MNRIIRDKCIVCKNPLTDLKTFKDFPIYMGTTTNNTDTDLTLDMTFSKCLSCDTIQLRNLVPLEKLYEKGHNSSQGKLWTRHHLEFSQFINETAKGNIVEIGGAQLILAKHLERNNNIETITVYDTNLSFYGNKETNKIALREHFFNKGTVSQRPDSIIHSHVVEHLYNPIEEVEEMSQLLDDGKYMYVSAPVIDEMMNDKYTNSMNFEHTYGLTKELLYKILTSCQLRVTKERYFNRHCVFVAAVKDSTMSTQRFYKQDPQYFYNFINYYQEEVERIRNLLNGERTNTFIFGAHIFTQSLLKFGLSEEYFSFILDNDSAKQGERLYGTNLEVKSPKILKNVDKPLVVLKAGQYTEEIKEDILKNINANTRFIL